MVQFSVSDDHAYRMVNVLKMETQPIGAQTSHVKFRVTTYADELVNVKAPNEHNHVVAERKIEAKEIQLKSAQVQCKLLQMQKAHYPNIDVITSSLHS